jgi:ketosteroid isomerase-like protein
MSPQKVEVAQWIENTQRAMDAWNREDLAAFLETWHPDCEWRPAFPRSLEGVGTVYRGREGITRAWNGVRAVWEEYQIVPEDAQVVGDNLVAVGRIHARGAARKPSKPPGCGSRRCRGTTWRSDERRGQAGWEADDSAAVIAAARSGKSRAETTLPSSERTV